MFVEGLDKTDNMILTELEKNARASYSEIGEKVGISRVSVKKRIEALEIKGVIRGYKVLVEAEKATEGRRFFLDIITEPETFERTAQILNDYAIIRKIYAVTGESRIHAEGFALSNTRYEMFLKSMKRQLVGIKAFTLQDVIYTIKDTNGGIFYENSKSDSRGQDKEGTLQRD